MKVQISDNKKKKWENFWYYYKYHVLLGGFFLFALVVFIHDMLTKPEYDYTIAVVGDMALYEEDKNSLQTWFKEHGEDLNGDGEIQVQVSDYYIPKEDEDPQILMANQTKLTVDMQEADSIIYFFSDASLERYKDSGVLSAEDSAYTPVAQCKGFEEAGSPASVQDMVVGMRILNPDTKQSQDPELQEYYKACEALLAAFIGA